MTFAEKNEFKLNELNELKDIYKDLNNVINNVINKLTKITTDTENDELFLKLSKITNKVLRAKFELADDVLELFEVEE